jgi:hypothetical protein
MIKYINQFGLLLVAALFLTSGVSHFLLTRFFVAIMPPYLPWPYCCGLRQRRLRNHRRDWIAPPSALRMVARRGRRARGGRGRGIGGVSIHGKVILGTKSSIRDNERSIFSNCLMTTASHGPLDGYRVFVAEDESLLLLDIAHLLTMAGADVIGSSSIRSATFLAGPFGDTSLEPDLDNLLWHLTDLFHKKAARVQSQLDDNEDRQRRSQNEQDGSEVRSVELETHIAQAQGYLQSGARIIC